MTTSASAARPLRIGFLEGRFANDDGATFMKQARDNGADVLRLPSSWGRLAPTRPAAPTDPADPAYTWAVLDREVKRTAKLGLAPLIALDAAPAWAEGPNRPPIANPGVWRPDPVAFGQFARALARRYDGSYPDPDEPGTSLPRVVNYQPWNEPNLRTYLAPQWVRRGGRYVAESPIIYRNLQNAFTKGIHAVAPAAIVATAGTAPFGNPEPGGKRMQPVRFWRELLCLTPKLARVKGCGTVDFDAMAHHAYSVGSPRRAAKNADDVSVPDLGKLTRLLKAAERVGTAPGKHRVWATELAWDSGPDDPHGLPERLQARWMADSFMLLWLKHVDTVIWYQVIDQGGPDYAASVQSGIYRVTGEPKLSARAFAFPVAIERHTATTARVWLRSPAAGTITLQVLRRGTWAPAKRISATRHGVSEATVTLKGGSAVRAVQGRLTSLPASVYEPG